MELAQSAMHSLKSLSEQKLSKTFAGSAFFPALCCIVLETLEPKPILNCFEAPPNPPQP